MDNLTLNFYNTIAKSFAEEQKGRFPWQAALEEFAERMPAQAEIVDLGCGPGRESLWLAEHIKEATITGVDFSSEMIAIAQEATAPHLTFVQADITTYTHPKPADGIWARGVLHHLDEDALLQTLKHAASYLSPTGLFCCINKYGNGSEVRSTSRWSEPAARYFNYFNEEKMEAFAAQSGLAIERQYVAENDENDRYLITYLKH